MTEEQQGSNATPNQESTAKTTTNRGRRGRPTGKEDSALTKAQPSGGLNLRPAPSGLPSNRPVEASKLRVVDTYTAVGGIRPVTASTMEVSGSMVISGNRPIALSHLKITETFGNRPVASNEIDDPNTLMGYLD